MIFRAASRLKPCWIYKNTYQYLTPIEKPVTSLALNSIIEGSAETMQFCFTQFAAAPQISVLVGAFAFRVGLQFAGLFFQSLNMKHRDNWVTRWIDKIFLVDLRRDVDFYELSPERHRAMANYYRPEQLFTSLLKTYTIVNFLRGAHYIITNPQFSSFCTSTLLPLSSHDPFFVLPIMVIGLNYFILSGSQHPFFIHLVRKENKLMCFNIAFMTGLLFVPSPAIYPLAYLGIALGHLTVRSLNRRIIAWKQMLKNIFTKRQP